MKKEAPAETTQTVQIFDRFLALTHDGVYLYTFSEGKILYANSGFARILDLDCAPEAVPGKRLEDLMIYTEAPGTIRNRADAKGEVRNFEYHFKTLKGEDRWVRHDSGIIMDPETGEKVVEAFVRDITESKRAEMELRASMRGSRPPTRNWSPSATRWRTTCALPCAPSTGSARPFSTSMRPFWTLRAGSIWGACAKASSAWPR